MGRVVGQAGRGMRACLPLWFAPIGVVGLARQEAACPFYPFRSVFLPLPIVRMSSLLPPWPGFPEHPTGRFRRPV